MGVDVGVDDLERIERPRDDDAEVAVAPVVVAQVEDERRRIAAVELVGRAVGVVLGVGVVVADEVVGLLETLVAAVVPVDAVNQRGEAAHDERHLPVAFVVDLSGAGEDAGQRRGFLDVRNVVGGVVDRRVADEIDVGGDGKTQVHLPPGVAANHLRLQGVELGRAAQAPVGQRVVLAFERPVGAVFVEEKGQPRADGAVEDGQFPILFVVDLAVARQDGREPAYLGERHGIAHEPPLAIGTGREPGGIGLFGAGFRERTARCDPCGGDGIEREQVVGAQFGQPDRIGPELGIEQRIEFGGKGRVGERVGPELQRIGPGHRSSAHDGAGTAAQLGVGGRPQGQCGQQEEQSEPDSGHGLRSGRKNVR